jgi:MFS family permease
MMVLLILTTDLTLGYTSTGEAVPPPDAPSLTWLSVAFFLFGICLWFADATCDAIVAEKARCEPIDRRGSLQSTCYACRFFGLMVSAPLSNYLYAHVGPQVVIYLLALIPAVTFPLCYLLKEERNVPIRSVSAQCNEIWDTVCSRSVWEPMGFIYLFNLLQVQNAAWRQFLRTVWSFSDSELNDLLVASYVLLYVGTMVYKYCFLQISWRHVYLGCILLNGVFSGLQLLFIRGKTLGLSPFWFALGDDAMAEFIAGVQFLPCTIMMVALTPAGSEGGKCPTSNRGCSIQSIGSLILWTRSNATQRLTPCSPRCGTRQ